MIDLTTLAAAKAYTDKKCGNAGGGLPVVELETVATMEWGALSEADAAKMNTLNGGVCIMKMTADMGDEIMQTIQGVPMIMTNPSSTCYAFNFGTGLLSLMVMDGTWMIAIQTMG